MASVFKRCRTAPVPLGAIIEETDRAIPKGASIEHGVATWTDRRGVLIGGPITDSGRRVVMREATWTDGGSKRTANVVPEGGRMIASVDRCYSAKFKDAKGKWVRKSTGTSDREAAKSIANKWEADAKQRQTGAIDGVAETLAEHGNRPIEEHLNAFIAFRATKGGTEAHRHQTRSHIEEFAAAGGWECIADIDANDVTAHVETMRAAKLASRTIQARLQSIKSFTKWLTDHHKLRLNPLSMVSKPDPNSDRVHERRMLLPDEWTWLELALKDAPERNSMTAKERSMLYQLAIQTGLRAREIEGLSRGKVVLSGKSPHVLCKAAGTKNRKPAKQYIDEQLAAELSDHLATKHPTAPVFTIGSVRELSRVLAHDLVEARRLWLGSLKGKARVNAESSDFLCKTNHDGEHLVFHSLRHTCGAWLAMDGEHVKSVQMVMRHGTVTLTIDRYGHLFPGQVEGAASRIADIMRGKRVGTILGTTAAAGRGG